MDFNSKFKEALARAGHESRYYKEYSWLGNRIPENVGKSIRARLAIFISACSRYPIRYESLCVSKWFILNLRDSKIIPSDISSELRCDINDYINILDKIIIDFESTNRSVDPNVFNNIIIASDTTPETFIYGQSVDAWGDDWTMGPVYYNSPNGRLTTFSNDFIR
jgi:hypothetical protein